MVTIKDVIEKAEENKATHYCYSFYDDKEKKDEANYQAIIFLRNNKEVLSFTVDFLYVEGFILACDFPKGRHISQTILDSYSEPIKLTKTGHGAIRSIFN